MCTVTIEKGDKKMADWDDIMNNRLTMGKSRPLIYALNAARRRRENGEEERRLGLIPPAGRGIRPVVVVSRFEHFGGFWEENYYLDNTPRGRSRPFPHPIHFYKFITDFNCIACHTAWPMDLEAMQTPTCLVPLE